MFYKYYINIKEIIINIDQMLVLISIHTTYECIFFVFVSFII